MINLVEHHPHWAQQFSDERERLLQLFPGAFVSLEHIGSTSVPGLRAKPILDILGTVPNLPAFTMIEARMEQLGYVIRGDNGIEARRYFTRKAAPSVHLHVFEANDPKAEAHLHFRNALRKCSRLRTEYEALKLQLASTHAGNRANYTAGKSAFCVRVSRLDPEL